jgi:tetratricopeptide (TPR) repeat protein/transcriptional regulator with XRE-family HTH domain
MESLASSSFGEMLKRSRKRQQLTQRELAGRLGVHINTIGIWERGVFLPETKGMVLELAKHLRLSELETRQLLEASLTGLSPMWNVPYLRNPFFTGREEILEVLQRRLAGSQVVALTQSYALSGLGGIGKTHLAVEYTYRHGLSYAALFWIAAETAETILNSFAGIAECLQLPERKEADQQKLVAAVQRWLSTHDQWLLIWDNLENLALLQRFLPATRTGAVLITTRLQALGTLAQGIELSQMSLEEGMLFLLRRAGLLSPEARQEDVDELARKKPGEHRATEQLVRMMDGLPLALDQAGAYVQETQCRLVDYLELFETKQGYLLSRRGEGTSEHPASVAATWSLSFGRVEQQNPTATTLLRSCAFLHPDAIPEELFLASAEHLGLVGLDRLALDEAVRLLLSYSLLRRDPNTATLSIHRLVQAVLRETVPTTERKKWQDRVVQALAATFPDRVRYELGKGERLLPHLLVCIPWIESEEQPTLVAARLLNQTGEYLRVRGQYAEGEPLLQRALALREQLLGAQHRETATSLGNLAIFYLQQGKYSQAEPLYQQALAIKEQVLGELHSETADSLNNLAILYCEQGKYSQAETLFQRGIAIYEQLLGAQHPDTATSLGNLAQLYYIQGKYSQAEPLFQRALAVCESQLGSQHPETAHSLLGLATLYRDQGKDAEAEIFFLRALAIREQALDPNHPDLAETRHKFAVLRQAQGRHDEARTLYERALAARTHTVGSEHPDTIDTRNRLVTLLRDMGLSEEAVELEREMTKDDEEHR